MPLTCNAVGDVLALIELAIVIAKFLNDSRGAPAECRALCNELRSLERLLALSKPTILALRDNDHRQIIAERMQTVSARIEEGLELIVKFRSAFDASGAAGSARSWRTTSLRWATKVFQSIDWTLRKSANAKACRLTIAQSFEPLNFSLLIAFQADQKAVLGVLQDAFTGLADAVKAGYATLHDIAAEQEALRADTLFLKEAFNKHLMALFSVQEEVSSVRVQFADALAATRLDIADVRKKLDAFCNTSDTIAQDSGSTRATLETFVVTFSDNRLADRDQLTSMDTKLDQVMQLLEQQAEKTQKSNSVRSWGIPGLRQLRAAAARAYELTPNILSGVTRAVLSDEVITTSIGLVMTASSGTDQVACGVAALLLVAAMKTCQLYKTPVVVHVVFVEDFFGFALEIPASKCSNPQDFHAALTRSFEGRMGLVLIQRRKYELQLVDSPTSFQQASPWGWQRPLEPGAHIHMNTYVQRHNQDVLNCPACSAPVINPDESSAPDHSWVACTFCRTMVQLSRRETKRAAQNVEPLLTRVMADDDNVPASTSSTLTGNQTSTDESDEKLALQRCRRIRVLLVTPAPALGTPTSLQPIVYRAVADEDSKTGIENYNDNYLQQRQQRRQRQQQQQRSQQQWQQLEQCQQRLEQWQQQWQLEQQLEQREQREQLEQRQRQQLQLQEWLQRQEQQQQEEQQQQHQQHHHHQQQQQWMRAKTLKQLDAQAKEKEKRERQRREKRRGPSASR